MVSFTVFKGSKEGRIVESTSTREVGPEEVLVRITHSGVCGTDEHYHRMDQVLGHEGAGLVEEIGTAVKSLQKGDSVGWGYQHNSCLNCRSCLTGRETLCPERKMFGSANLDQGSFGHYAVWNAGFVYKIPSSISREHAAPLMCGGATVYSALASFGARSHHRVGIMGIGGLGHLAIQFAAKMGCGVVVFSSNEDKREEAMRLGATEFIVTKGVSELKVSAPIDHLLVCASRQPDWKLCLPIMAPGGAIYPLTVSMEDFQMPYSPLVMGELKIQGSLIAARQVQRDMLAFAALHYIVPLIEKFPMTVDGITECMDKLRRGEVRYRGVLVVDSEVNMSAL